MSRRDTIIIAVLLNAGLLIVLFATSLKSDSSDAQPPPTLSIAPTPLTREEPIAPPAIVAAPSKAAPVLSMGEEVEQTTKNYVPPLLSTSPESKPNFAADLQAIAEPSLSPIVIAPAPVAAPESDFHEVKVQKGDVLERIARKHHVTVEEIMKANNLQNARLKIGQVLKIPAKTAKTETAQKSVVDEESVKYYTVKQGDNPWTIAVKNHMKVEELLKLNNLNEEKARRLKPGDRIRIK